MLDKIGVNIEPWGTPERTCSKELQDSLAFVLWFPWELLIIQTDSQSKAFERSINGAPNAWLLSLFSNFSYC